MVLLRKVFYASIIMSTYAGASSMLDKSLICQSRTENIKIIVVSRDAKAAGFVYENNQLKIAKWVVQNSKSTNSGIQFITFKSFEHISNGGLNLRIQNREVGLSSAHLSIKLEGQFKNKLMECEIIGSTREVSYD